MSISAVPTAEAAGHAMALSVPAPNCASVHAFRPLAAEGSIVRPGGSVTVASCRLALAMCAGFSSWGTWTSMLSPSGVSRCVVFGVAVIVGEKGTLVHPLAPTGVVNEALPLVVVVVTSIVVVCGPAHAVGLVRKALSGPPPPLCSSGAPQKSSVVDCRATVSSGAILK